MEAARRLKAKYPEVVFNVLGAFYPGNPTAVSEQDMAAWEREGVIQYLGISNEVPLLIAQANSRLFGYFSGYWRMRYAYPPHDEILRGFLIPGCFQAYNKQGLFVVNPI